MCTNQRLLLSPVSCNGWSGCMATFFVAKTFSSNRLLTVITETHRTRSKTYLGWIHGVYRRVGGAGEGEFADQKMTKSQAWKMVDQIICWIYEFSSRAIWSIISGRFTRPMGERETSLLPPPALLHVHVPVMSHFSIITTYQLSVVVWWVSDVRGGGGLEYLAVHQFTAVMMRTMMMMMRTAAYLEICRGHEVHFICTF